MAQNILYSMLGWFGLGLNGLTERPGKQEAKPATALVSDVADIKVDGALQLAAVWSCIERRANVVASLPFFVYERDGEGQKKLARQSSLYALLHDSPNSRMTPIDFWRVMMMNHDLRGNAYARIDRNARGEAISLWPLPADQVEVSVLEDGSVVYLYRMADIVQVLAEENVLHLKNLGNGTVGLSKLEYMRVTTDEAYKAQQSASKIFGNGGKPTGVLMVDSVLKPEQREAIKASFGQMATGNATGRLFVLEAKMDYKQLSISPEDMQLLESRRFSVEEICRWFDVPPVLAHHSNVTTWGSGIDSIMDGWYKLSVRPMLVAIEQAVTKRVLTPGQKARLTVEFSFDALLRGALKERYESYQVGINAGFMKPNEARQLENLPPVSGGDRLMVQAQMMPIEQIGKGAMNAAEENPVSQ
jgi:HK97 family phage portal protein